MIKISNIGKTWGNGSPLVQPYCKSALQKLVKLKMHRPWEHQLHMLYLLTETLAPVPQNAALIVSFSKVTETAKCLPV